MFILEAVSEEAKAYRAPLACRSIWAACSYTGSSCNSLVRLSSYADSGSVFSALDGGRASVFSGARCLLRPWRHFRCSHSLI